LRLLSEVLAREWMSRIFNPCRGIRFSIWHPASYLLDTGGMFLYESELLERKTHYWHPCVELYLHSYICFHGVMHKHRDSFNLEWICCCGITPEVTNSSNWTALYHSLSLLNWGLHFWPKTCLVAEQGIHNPRKSRNVIGGKIRISLVTTASCTNVVLSFMHGKGLVLQSTTNLGLPVEAQLHCFLFCCFRWTWMVRNMPQPLYHRK
jgi:hypothetical protein